MGRVIRAQRDPAPVVAAAVVEAKQQASELLADARRRAERQLQAAHDQAAEVRQRAEREGHERALARAAALLIDAERARDQALQQARTELVQLALAAARHIVGEELALHPERVEHLVAELLSRARRARRLELRLHPDDAATVRTRLPEALRERVRVETDDAIARGGCILHSDVGVFDGRLEVRLEALARAVMSELEDG